MNSNPALGLIGFWMMLQLAATIAILLGGIYALYCLGRASAGLDRMASAMEEWVAQQRAASTAIGPNTPNVTPLAQRIEPSALHPSAVTTATSTPLINTPSMSTPASSSEVGEQSTPSAVTAQPFAPAASLSSTSNPPINSPSSSSHEPTV